jgi:hypothetical protein
MDKKSDLPDGWAMPYEMAKKVSDILNNKTISPEDEPADALDEMARDIALIEPEPKDWGVWVNYLLESLQSEAQKERKSAADEEMLLNLREALETRIGEANGKNPKGCVGLD